MRQQYIYAAIGFGKWMSMVYGCCLVGWMVVVFRKKIKSSTSEDQPVVVVVAPGPSRFAVSHVQWSPSGRWTGPPGRRIYFLQRVRIPETNRRTLPTATFLCSCGRAPPHPLILPASATRELPVFSFSPSRTEQDLIIFEPPTLVRNQKKTLPPKIDRSGAGQVNECRS